MVKFGMLISGENLKMQTTRQLQSDDVDVTKLHVSSYELITLWLDKGFTLGISSNALQLMTVLLRFYNPNKKFVFPLQETLAERTNTSIASVKRGLNELIKVNLILKRRTQRGNVYGFTGALFDLLNGSNRTVPTVQNEPCMNNEQNKEKLNKRTTTNKEVETSSNKVVAFSSKSSYRKVTLADVPDIIKNNKKVKDPCAYWASLDEETKQEKLKEQQEAIEKKERIAKAKEEAERKKEAERRQREYEASLPPFYMRDDFTRENAVAFVRRMPLQLRFKGMSKEIAERFNISREELL